MSFAIIAYDISNPKRLQKIYRTLIKHATPIEYSVFLFSGTEQQKLLCMNEVKAIMNPKEDDVRCYPLPLRGLQQRIGRATMPEGIHWTGLPAGDL